MTDDTRARIEAIRERHNQAGDAKGKVVIVDGLSLYIPLHEQFMKNAWGDIGKLLEHNIVLTTEIERLEKVAEWLSQAVANSGWTGERRSAESWREEAERMVDGE